MTVERCGWARNDLAIRYHDEEWGLPVHDDRKLFEFIILEGAQAGLSWDTILGRREGYRRAFDGFDPAKVARYGEGKVQELLADPGIIRNRAKVASAIKNAQAFLILQEEFGSFDTYQWGFVEGVPKVNEWKSLDEIPASTDLSDAFSKDLKTRGFSFVGTTIMYAHMQAVGMVNDHLTSCFRWGEVQ